MVNAARIGGSIPFYQHSLSLLGQYLNRQRAARPVIAEVETGFLLVYFAHNQWLKPISTDIHHADLLGLSGEVAGSLSGKDGLLLKGGDQRDKKHRVCPMGYDVFLRVIGERIDRRGGVGVTICDSGDRIYVGYWVDKATFVIRDGRRQPVSTAQLEVYDAKEAKKLVDAAEEAHSQEMRRYQQGLRLNARDYISMLSVALLLESEGHYREAEGLLHRILAAVPEHPEAHYHLGRMALLRGDARQALTEAKKAVSLQGDDAAVHDLYGCVQQHLHHKKEAIAAFELAVKLRGDHGLFHYHLAQAYEAAGQSDEAAVQMALSSQRVAAPALDMMREEITLDDMAAPPEPLGPAPMSLSEALPAESALLPRIVDEPAGLARMPVPTMTTTFEPAASTWPPAPAAGQKPAPARAPVPAPPANASAPSADTALPSVPLEQRLRQGWQAPVQPTPLPVEASLPDLAALGQYSSPASSAAVPVASEPPTPVRAAKSKAVEGRARSMTSAPLIPRAVPVEAASPPRGEAPGPEAAGPEAVELAAEILSVQRALGAEPNRADLHRKLGFLLARQGKTAEAATEFRKALQASRTSL